MINKHFVLAGVFSSIFGFTVSAIARPVDGSGPGGERTASERATAREVSGGGHGGGRELADGRAISTAPGAIGRSIGGRVGATIGGRVGAVAEGLAGGKGAAVGYVAGALVGGAVVNGVPKLIEGAKDIVEHSTSVSGRTLQDYAPGPELPMGR